MTDARTIQVRFLPEGAEVDVLPGTTILEAAGRANIIVETPCGGAGTCGQCRVRVLQNAPPPSPMEERSFSRTELAAGWRLACQARVTAAVTVEVPASSRFLGQKILAHGVDGKYSLEPCVALDPDDRAGRLLGAAFDIGTTTLVGALLDLASDETLATASRANPQIPLGDDVIARIAQAGRPGGLAQLRSLVIDCVNEMIAEMCAAAGVATESVYEVTFAGNTTMNHLLLGIDPTPLAHAPYKAVLLESCAVPAPEFGLRIRPTGQAYTLPNIAGFVGGDTVGVILAAAMQEHDGIELALDIGTNGEIVLGGRDRLVACSTAAGPAFEGARIRQGMRAARGAIEKVLLDGADVQVHVIGGAPARGLCGTGVIDAVAALLDAGIVDSSGRMLPPDELPSALPDALRRRVIEQDGQVAFELVRADDASGGRPVRLTQRDVREVQLGKAAFLAGATIILREYGIAPEQLDRVLLAGAFGNFLRARSVLRIGLMPPLPESRVEFIGNAAGTGARMVLADRSCREAAEWIAKHTEYVELAGRSDFQEEFASALMFPEQDSPRMNTDKEEMNIEH